MRTALVALALLALACVSDRYVTNSKRSATEQCLLSESAELAAAQLALPSVAGKRVAIEVVALADVARDAEYLKSALAERLQVAGARISAPDQAEMVAAVRVGAIGSSTRRSSFGVPSVPIPGIGTTPELAFISILKRRGYTGLRMVLQRPDGTLVHASQPTLARASRDLYTILFFTVRSGSIRDGDGRFGFD